MKYWIYLAWQYMMCHKSRTLYSIFGIIISFIMCFSILTAGFSIWDYAFQLTGGEKAQLWAEVSNVNEEDEEQGLTEGMIEQIQTLEGCDEVKRLWIYDDTEQYEELSSLEDVDEVGEEVTKSLKTAKQLQPGHSYSISIQLKDLSDLQHSAEVLQEQCGLDIRVYDEAATYLGQGGDTLFRSFYRTIEVILASVVALFSVMILRNTMMISIVERMRDYGIYRCVGMSRRQLYCVLAAEGLMMSLVAVVCGIGVGYGLLQSITPWLNHALDAEIPFHFGFYFRAVLYTTLMCIGVTLFALIEPARQTGQLSPVEAMHNNIVLRTRKGKRRDRLTYHQGGAWGKIFGICGEYAYKNMQRNRGRFSGLFISLLVCMVFVGIMESVGESLYATIHNVYQGKNKKYIELLIPNQSKFEDGLSQQIQKDLWEIDGVKDTGIIFETSDPIVGVDLRLHDYMINSSRGISEHFAYERKEIESLRQYLLDGKIDYDSMTQENGVLLCDMKYNEKSIETDFNQKDVRITEYQVGDRIKCLSQTGWQKTNQIYDTVIEQVAGHFGMEETDRSADEDGKYSSLQYCTMGEEGFEEYREECIRFFKKQGIDFSAKKAEVTSIYSFKNYLSSWLMEHGEAVEYVIQGIISEDAVMGCMDPCIEFIHTVDEVQQTEGINNADNYDFGRSWTWGVMVSRDSAQILNSDLQGYCNRQTKTPMFYSNLFDSAQDFDIQGYLDMLHTMKIVRSIAILFIVCIAVICLIQIYNTLCANITIRRKELRLYELVGMGHGQMKKMLLLEHIATAFLAVLAGYFLSWAASWYFVEYLLNQDGSIHYVWSGPTVAFMGVGVLVLTVFVCLSGIHSTYRRNPPGDSNRVI